jgi:UDP-N-acetyl-D-mannosaminuronic acid dehydrogenase
VVTSARTAEMAKLTENSCRDVQIAFANELSIICDKLDVDVWELIALANRHPRINILQPGPGVGGHCIAVDPWFIVSRTPNEARLIRTARMVNDSKPEWVVNNVKIAVAEYIQKHPSITATDITIACYGLAFKANIDDLRESPSLKITSRIAEEHPGKVVAIEPNITQLPKNESLKFDLVDLVDLETLRVVAQVHVLLVDHDEFEGLKLDVESPDYRIVDTRGAWMK